MKFVIDTNILLVSISRTSRYHWIFEKLLENKYILCATTDILSEYEEIISQFFGYEVAKDILETLDNLPNVEYYTKYYRWNLIKDDYDDNKFVDCAIVSNSASIVTNDKHFKILSEVEFPKVQVIGIEEFKRIFIINKK